jgi:carbon-monoxide dehydrogenase catalytic subunit
MSAAEIKKAKKEKKADPKASSVDQATIETLAKAQAEGIETIFDRALTMKPCNIGEQGTCCKICSQGPCRMPLPKKGIEGDDTRKGLCGATP